MNSSLSNNITFSLYQAMNKFGFSSNQQKNALEILLKESSILEVNESFIDKFPPRNSFNEFALDMLTLVKQTQERFVIRKATQERWEVSGAEWMQKITINKAALLNSLNVIKEIKPTVKKADILCILGSTMPSMMRRLDYATLLIEQGLEIKKIILLSGERYANPSVDNQIAEVATYFNLKEVAQVTEAHLIKYLFENSSLNRSYPVHLIDTPKNNLPRPTTQTTMIDFAKWFKSEDIDYKDVIFVSSQPNIKYQEAIISQILRYSEISVNFELVGPSFDENNFPLCIGGLGSFIFANTPNVLIDYKEVITDSNVNNLFKDLYYSQPLIYSDAVVNHLINQNMQLLSSEF